MAQPGWLPKLVSWRRYLARETGRQQGRLARVGQQSHSGGLLGASIVEARQRGCRRHRRSCSVPLPPSA